MKLNIQLEEQDYVDAALSAATPTAQYITLTLALLLGALVLTGFFATHGYAREAIIGFGVLLGALLGMFIEQRLTIPRKARKVFYQQGLNKSFELEWNDEGIFGASANGSFTIPWSEIWKVRVLEKQILLFLSDVNFVMVPNRFFPDTSTLGTFKNLLGRVTKFG
jgi:hypothetical protein